MNTISDDKIKSWEFKLALPPELMSELDSAQISAFLSRVFVPSVIRHHMKVKPVSQPGATICTVLFYDTPAPGFSYYDYLADQGSEGGFIIRWREFSPQPPGRSDLTLKLRSTDQLKVLGQNTGSSLPDCDDLELKLELCANTSSSSVTATYALDNELKSTAEKCAFPSSPPRTGLAWSELFPILEEVGVSGSVEEVNRILVSQTQLQLVELEFDGVKGSVAGDLIVWENFNYQQNGYGQYLAAEFSYTVKSSQLESKDKLPESCEKFLDNLRRKAAENSWLGDSLKTHTVYFPPAG